jgi:WD40 repeat protein
MLAIFFRLTGLNFVTLGAMACGAAVLLGSGKSETTARKESLDAVSIAAEAPSSASGTDRYGDPLPRGAVMRLGTARFRQTPFIIHIVYSPDGQLVLTDNASSQLQLWDARDGRRLRSVDVRIENLRDFACSPNGKTIAAVGFLYDSDRNARVGRLTFTDLQSGRAIRQIERDDAPFDSRVAYSADGKIVMTMSNDGTLRLCEVAGGAILHIEPNTERNRPALAFSPDAASNLLAIGRERTIRVWDFGRRREVRTIVIDGEVPPTSVAFSPDGATLAAAMAARGTEIRLWRVSDGTLIRRFNSPETTELTHFAYSPDGKVLGGTGDGTPPVLFDVATGSILERFHALRADGPMAFSPDGKTLAGRGNLQTLHFWDVATANDRLATPDAHTGGVGCLAFVDGGKTLVSGSDDRTVRIWDLATGQPTKLLQHDGSVRSLSVSGDGSLLATGSSGRGSDTVLVWNPKSGARMHDWLADHAMIRGLKLSGNGGSMAIALSDGSLRWDVVTGNLPAPQRKLDLGLDKVSRAVFSADGHSVALIGDNWVQVVDVDRGNVNFKETLELTACEFAPDGRSLVIARRDFGKFLPLANGMIRYDDSTAESMIVWLDNRTGRVLREIAIPKSTVQCVAFSPDGQAVAAGVLLNHPERGFIRIFRLRDKHEIQSIETPCPWIESLAFTPDGKRIAAGLLDTSIVIWDVRGAE